MSRNRYHKKTACFQAPVSVNISVTEKCNLRCPFCFHDYGNETDLSFEVLQDILNQLVDMGTESVQFSGGDPLLYPYLTETVAFANSMGMYTRIATSGSDLTLDYAQKLKEAGLDCCHISLNASREEIHNLSRSDFYGSVHALQLLEQVGIPCTVNWVASHDNIHDLPDFIEFAKKSGVQGIDILAYKANNQGEIPSPCTLEDLKQIAEIVAKNPDFLRIERCFYELRHLVDGGKIAAIDKGCTAGRFFFAVNADGQFMPCPHLSSYAVSCESVRKYWEQEISLLKFREEFQKEEHQASCAHCNYKKQCNPCYIDTPSSFLRKTDCVFSV